MTQELYILAVDDHEVNLKLISNYLRDSGYKLILANDGNKALEILKDGTIDLILLDIMMPDMDGYEVCRKVKENPKTSEIPVIFLTAKTQTEDLVESFKTGAVDFITKPFKRDELLMRVKTHLDLAVSRKKIVEMNRTRDKLYSIIAHDIRSPFAAITQTIDTIINGYIEIGTAEYFETFQLLKQKTEQTSMLLNNLLEWTKLHSDSISLSPKMINIHEMLAECLQLMKGIALHKNITIDLEISGNTQAFFDEVTIHTAFRNIISNAIKFTPENGRILITSAKAGEFIAIVIQDTGSGISKENIDKVLNAHDHTASTANNNEMGNGLGLFLIRDFVEQNHGKIKVESREGSGTNFMVYLPVNAFNELNTNSNKIAVP